MVLDPGRPTGTCLVLIEPGGERTMAPDAGANDALSEDDLPDDLLGGRRASARVRLRAAARGIAAGGAGRDRTGIESGDSACPSTRPRPRSSMPAFLDHAEGAGLLLPNASEAHALTGDSDPEARRPSAGASASARWW